MPGEMDRDHLDWLIARAEAGKLTPQEQQDLTILLAQVPPAPPRISFREFVSKVEPNYRWWWHLEVLAKCLEQLITGEIENLMVSMPPRHGKSMTTSQLFIAYYMYLFPFRKVGFSGYNDNIAWFHARHAKDYYLRSGGGLHGQRDIDAVKNWQAAQGGELWVTGRGGSATGLGYHLGVGDDWLKNSDEARSPVIRQGTIEWLQSVWLTRGEPNARKVVIGTRWPPYDPMTYLLDVARNGGEFAEKWHIINFEAIRTAEKFPIPPSCTLEPDPRPVWNGSATHEDAALCPQRVPMKKLLALKSSTSTFYFGAMYQGRPKPREGMMFKGHWFKIVHALPAIKKRVWFWDVAGTEEKLDETKQPDFTAGIRGSKGEDDRYYLELGARFMRRPAGRNAGMRAWADKTCENLGVSRDSFRVGFEADTGVDGEERIKTLTGVLAGYRCAHYRPRRSKIARATSGDTIFAESFQAQCEVGNVLILCDGTCEKCMERKLVEPEGEPWVSLFLDELCSFPNGLNDDWVDAAVGAFTMLTEGYDPDLEGPIAGDAVPSAPLNVMAG